jgi:hypothetical protein
MNRGPIPQTIAGFTEYIQIVYPKAQTNLSIYGISPDKLSVITPLYTDYLAKEKLAGNPETATKAHREARDVALDKLKKAWRQFLNESVRYNTLIDTADKAVFGITPRDGIRTPVQAPIASGNVDAKRRGAFEYELTVTDQQTTKRKLPEHATGSYLYLSITEPGVLPEDISTYRKLDFSSNAHHKLIFSPSSDYGKQANVYARYANQHGQEGPAGPITTFLIN